jgi:hypothetical protein
MRLLFPVLALLVLITGLAEERADVDVPLLAAKAVVVAVVTAAAADVVKLFDIF